MRRYSSASATITLRLRTPFSKLNERVLANWRKARVAINEATAQTAPNRIMAREYLNSSLSSAYPINMIRVPAPPHGKCRRPSRFYRSRRIGPNPTSTATHTAATPPSRTRADTRRLRRICGCVPNIPVEQEQAGVQPHKIKQGHGCLDQKAAEQRQARPQPNGRVDDDRKQARVAARKSVCAQK